MVSRQGLVAVLWGTGRGRDGQMERTDKTRETLVCLTRKGTAPVEDVPLVECGGIVRRRGVVIVRDTASHFSFLKLLHKGTQVIGAIAHRGGGVVGLG